MAEANRREDAEIHLPETIIQHIQSFLSGKEAAGTTLLSKSWYNAWLTRPNLQFDFRDGGASAFVILVKNTIQRYERFDLKVESLGLRMRDAHWGETAKEFIVKAMKLGATELDIELHHSLELPQEVIGSQNLIRLSVTGCSIHQTKVNCSKLKSLSLSRVRITGHLILDISSCCPLIEELSFSECILILFIPRETWFHRALPLSPDDGQQNPLYEFHKLQRLFLDKLDFESTFFHDFSSKFPCIKDLSISDCRFRSMQISSPSLQCITIVDSDLRFANLDVPNIRQLAFSGEKFPCLCIKTPSSGEWKSDISITYWKPVDSWFARLKKFLKRLSSSKITLSLIFLTRSKDGLQLLPQPVDAQDVQSLPRPRVENLLLSVYDPSSQLLDGLFWSCRPKVITGIRNIWCSVFLWNTFAQERSESCSRRNTSYFDDLVEVNAEIFEESLAKWRPVAWKTLLDASASLYTHKVRFQLGWASELSTSS